MMPAPHPHPERTARRRIDLLAATLRGRTVELAGWHAEDLEEIVAEVRGLRSLSVSIRYDGPGGARRVLVRRAAE